MYNFLCRCQWWRLFHTKDIPESHFLLAIPLSFHYDADMRRIIIPLIVITLALAVSCSGSPKAEVAEIDVLTADGKPLSSSPTFSTDLFVVEVTYSDSSTEMLDADGLVTPVYDEEADGTTTWNGMVEASYGGKTIQKTFALETIEAPVYPNDDTGSVTYKELVSLSIYQIRPTTDGEPFDPSLFRIQAEYAGGPSEDLDGDGYVYLENPDNTMNKGDFVAANIRGYRVKLRIDFIDGCPTTGLQAPLSRGFPFS